MRVIIATASLALAASAIGTPRNEQFMGEVIQQAHDVEFRSCDFALREAFGILNGEGMRVVVLPTGDKDELRMAVVFGLDGGPSFHEAKISREGLNCKYFMTGVLPRTVPCDEVASEPSSFVFRVETLGAKFFDNENGVSQILVPSDNGSCTTIYMAANMTPASEG